MKLKINTSANQELLKQEKDAISEESMASVKLLTFWEQEHKKTKSLPQIDRFDPVKMYKILENVAVMCVKKDPTDFCCNIMGEKIIHFGQDMTGFLLSHVKEEILEFEILFDACVRVVKTKKPISNNLRYLSTQGIYKTIYYTITPFQKNNNNDVSHLVCSIEFLIAGQLQ